jgi:hypothetical protein
MPATVVLGKPDFTSISSGPGPDSAFLDPKRIAAAEAAIRDKYKESGGGSKRTAAAPGENEVARIKALIAEEQAYTKALQERGAEATKMTAGEKLVMQIQEQLSTSIKGVARSNKEAALAEAQKLVQAEKARQVEERRAKALQEAREANERLVADTWKTADGIEKQAAELDAANSMWGKGKVADEANRGEAQAEHAGESEHDHSERGVHRPTRMLNTLTDAGRAVLGLGLRDGQKAKNVRPLGGKVNLTLGNLARLSLSHLYLLRLILPRLIQNVKL